MIPLPDLPYDPDALEPVLSATTLQVHHGKHHRRYVEVINGLLADRGEPAGPLEDLIRRASGAGERKLFNNAAQAWNHSFFWRCMTPAARPPVGALADAIVQQFGSLADLGQVFVAEGAAHFGSGWVWLAAEDGRLEVLSTHDADTLVTGEAMPLLVCDLWEHAYYLDHQSDRAGFLQAWWDGLANWAFAEGQFDADRGRGVGWRHPSSSGVCDDPPPRGEVEAAAGELARLLESWIQPGSVHEHRLHELVELLAPEHGPCASGRADLAGGLTRRPARRLEEVRRRRRAWTGATGAEAPRPAR